MKSIIAALAGSLLLAGMSAAAEAPPPPVVPPLPPGAQPQPVSLTRMATQVPVGLPWAHMQSQGLTGCSDDKVLIWDAKSNKAGMDPEFDRVFRQELGRAGFRISGDPTNLFEQDTRSADLQIGALITNVAARFCAKEAGVFSDNARTVIKGQATMTIEWQVYSVSAAKLMARIPTTETYETSAGIDAGNLVILRQAFAANVRALAASDAFRQAVLAPVAAAPARPALDTITIAEAPAGATRSLDKAGASVAIVFAGAGMGSGFLISSDGYMLTNRHVVGDAAEVRIRWSDKSESVGQVIRSDRRRDVALIKTDPGGRTPLALRAAAPLAGETVFAIGTPLQREFQGTVTKGIVSATRVIEGLSFIQSDVAVDHGNSGGPLLDETGQVLGLTDWGYAPGGVSHNLNFFIPIDDALRALSLKAAPLAETNP